MEVEGELFDPFQLAELLGVDRRDAGVLAVAPVRLPAGWAKRWRTRSGAMELSQADVAMLVGRSVKTITRWCRPDKVRGLAPVLTARRAGPRDYRVSPAALVACLKKMTGDTAPPVIETPAQRERRSQASIEKARALCGQSKPPSRRKRAAA
ncbi:unnamed protein product [Gemmata massiliana]|uniref:Helix-turn-helix domain-containing protein n=1 Tax=Gemmata massiliana TaxID=1210884 RepID=A0A6P2CUY9_9BACT|nr:hypothetical protein [Gemmata massiliana]VTR92789.1 unnamed protein product [Gemmata massiliana]